MADGDGPRTVVDQIEFEIRVRCLMSDELFQEIAPRMGDVVKRTVVGQPHVLGQVLHLPPTPGTKVGKVEFAQDIFDTPFKIVSARQ